MNFVPVDAMGRASRCRWWIDASLHAADAISSVKLRKMELNFGSI